MIVYSKKIVRFVQEIKDVIKLIISKEIHLKVHGERFYERSQQVSYPIKVVIYNHKSMLGYFDADFYELGFHECLMQANKQQLHDIIRHELAHYLTFITYGETVKAHGHEFKALCLGMGWDENVYRATICLEDTTQALEQSKSAIFRKVQKLMALATSNNEHEAEQAMIKSQQLLLKHNIEIDGYDQSNDEQVFLKRILKQPRETAKMRAIAKILETFFVSTVYSRSRGSIYLEILGNAANIEVAEYVADVLQVELDKLWRHAQREAHLKGAIAKNSFLLGIAKGYCNKIHALKRAYDASTQQALVLIDKKIEEAKDMAYTRLSSKASSGRFCRTSSSVGEQMGRQLNIHPAVNKTSNSNVLIGFAGTK